LAGRGYALRSFENVLGRDLPAASEEPNPPGIEVSVSPPDEFDEWLDVVVEGVMHPDEQGVPGEQFDRQEVVNAERDLASTGVRRYLARLDGVVAGGAGLRLIDGIAEFAGAATAPALRRRGVQSALLSRRLADAAAAGCDVAVITTQPGSKSQENAQRRGFELLYTRAVLVRAQP
jgi:GNAT superfamily N-acetyltransferase